MMERPPLLRELTGRAKWVRVSVLTFTALHIVATCGAGGPRVVRPLNQVLAPYVSGLRMGARWDMFSKAPEMSFVEIWAETESGAVQLTSPEQTRSSLARRIRDARLRKLQNKLGDPIARDRIAPGLLDYFCRTARADGLAVTRVRAERPHVDRKRPGERSRNVVLYSRDCAQSVVEVPDGAPSDVESGL